MFYYNNEELTVRFINYKPKNISKDDDEMTEIGEEIETNYVGEFVRFENYITDSFMSIFNNLLNEFNIGNITLISTPMKTKHQENLDSREEFIEEDIHSINIEVNEEIWKIVEELDNETILDMYLDDQFKNTQSILDAIEWINRRKTYRK